MDQDLSCARLKVVLNSVGGLNTLEANEGMPTWKEWMHGLLQKFFLVFLKLRLNVVVVFVLAGNKAASITVLGYHKHVEILQIAHLDFNLEYFVEGWDNLHGKNFTASILFQKSFKQGL